MLALLWTTSFPYFTIVDVRLDFATGHRFSGRATVSVILLEEFSIDSFRHPQKFKNHHHQRSL